MARPVHPRVRGEQADRCQRRGAGCRFIPACAGSRVRYCLDQFPNAVHPRVRGEQGTMKMPMKDPGGSSPRARGAVPERSRRSGQRRFIPACAGSRYGRHEHGCERPVHPRVRGEQLTCCLSGSWVTRFIPACAGSRGSACWPARWHPVHPRVRGEQYAIRAPLHGEYGSSPRARGAGCLRWSPARASRFIPACAGSRADQVIENLQRNGSSPRARGAGDREPGREAGHRFIPACAGSRSGRWRPRICPSVHPRVRGEQVDAGSASKS